MKNRVIWKMFALTIVTLGIYRLYWFVKTRKEMMRTNPKIKIMTPLFFFIPLLIVLASVIVMIISFVQAGSSIPSYCGDYPYSESNAAPLAKECEPDVSVWPMLFFYFSILVVWPLMCIWLWSYSKGVEAITKGKTSFAMSLLVLLAVPDGIDILIIQDGFNKVSAPKAA